MTMARISRPHTAFALSSCEPAEARLVFATDKIAFDALKRSTGWDTEVDGEVLIMRCEGGCVRVDTINGSTLFFSYWSVDPAAECGGQHAR